MNAYESPNYEGDSKRVKERDLKVIIGRACEPVGCAQNGGTISTISKSWGQCIFKFWKLMDMYVMSH